MTDSFAGFSEDFFAFFAELAQNNDRAWFAGNKARYAAVVQGDLSAFVAAMAPRLRRISKCYQADPRPTGKTIFRIHRDVRFSRDKRPYKEHAACHFRHDGEADVHGPGFYVQLEPETVMFGGGIWKPSPDDLQKIRAAIAGDAKGWDRVVGDAKLVAHFGGISGEGLKRPPRGFPANHPHVEDLKRQTYYVMREAPAALARTPDLLDAVEDSYKAARPLMRFLSKAVGLPF